MRLGKSQTHDGRDTSLSLGDLSPGEAANPPARESQELLALWSLSNWRLHEWKAKR